MDIILIGNSRASKNLSSYLKFRNIPHKKIPYRKINKYITHINKYSIIFVLTKDDEIMNFYTKYKRFINKKSLLLHFSGSLYTKHITSLHPLFSLKKKVLKPDDFEKIIFTSENPSYIKKNLKWFKNKIIKINPCDKPLYHALISIYLNFPLIIKKSIEDELIKFKIPRNYLNYVFYRNIKDSLNIKNGLSGPVVRNDVKTIKSHLKVLKRTPFNSLYRSIIRIWRNYDNK